MYTEYSNYRERLHLFAISNVDKPFQWGKTDCISLCLRASCEKYRELDGKDLPFWTSLSTAKKQLDKDRTVKNGLIKLGWQKVTTLIPGDILCDKKSKISSCLYVGSNLFLSIKFRKKVVLTFIENIDNYDILRLV